MADSAVSSRAVKRICRLRPFGGGAGVFLVIGVVKQMCLLGHILLAGMGMCRLGMSGDQSSESHEVAPERGKYVAGVSPRNHVKLRPKGENT